MQTGKVRRTVSKLRQLQDEFNSLPATDLTLWTIKRTPGSPCELPPGLSRVTQLFTRRTETCEQYVTTVGPGDEQLFGHKRTFSELLNRTSDMLRQANLAPQYHRGPLLGSAVADMIAGYGSDYSDESILYIVADFALQSRINQTVPYYWQGGTTFAKSWADRMQIPLPCLDWFTKVDRLPEAIADVIDELLTGFETSADRQQPPARMEQPAAGPSKQPKRKSEVPAEKSQQEIAFGFLLLWHQYGNENFNNDPILTKQGWQQWMKDRSPDKPVPSPGTVTRMMKEMFGSMREYSQHCQARTIHRELAKAVLESAKVPQSKLPKEHITEDPEIDLD